MDSIKPEQIRLTAVMYYYCTLCLPSCHACFGAMAKVQSWNSQNLSYFKHPTGPHHIELRSLTLPLISNHDNRHGCMPQRGSLRAWDTPFNDKNENVSCICILVKEAHPKSINREEWNNAQSVNCWEGCGGAIVLSRNDGNIALLWV